MTEGFLLEHSKRWGKDKDLPLLPSGAGQQVQVSQVQRFLMYKVQLVVWWSSEFSGISKEMAL